MLKNLIDYLEKYAKADGWPQWAIDYVIKIAVPIAIIITLISCLYKLLKYYWAYRNQKIINKNVGPYFSNLDVLNTTKYYMPTRFQNVTPTEEDEPGQTYISSATGKLIPQFLKIVFKNTYGAKKYYILLADTGMGKTTFLINLIIKYKNRSKFPWVTSDTIKLISLASPDWVTEVLEIKDKEKTILLLDALDEDVEAGLNYKKRYEELINATWKFKTIVITCRTQFYPSQKDEPSETGAYSFGDYGEYKFQKLYISPFTKKESLRYINKRYPFYKIWKIKKYFRARKILKRCKFLMMRPMLLSHIEDLINVKTPLYYTYQIYEVLINKWISRESSKFGIRKKYGSVDKYESLLLEFSKNLAYNLFINKDKRRGYTIHKDEKFEIEGFSLADLEIEYQMMSDSEKKSKSLLNRTADGYYKFSHKSILEYFIASELIKRDIYANDSAFASNDAAKLFYYEMLIENAIKYFPGKFSLDSKEFISFKEILPHQIPLVTQIIITSFRDIKPSQLQVFTKLMKLYIGDPQCKVMYEVYEEYIGIISKCEKGSIVSLEEYRELSVELNSLINYEQSDYLVLYPDLRNWFRKLKDGAIVLKAHEFEQKKPVYKNFSENLRRSIIEEREDWDDRKKLIDSMKQFELERAFYTGKEDVDEISQFLNEFFCEINKLKEILPNTIIVI